MGRVGSDLLQPKHHRQEDGYAVRGETGERPTRSTQRGHTQPLSTYFAPETSKVSGASRLLGGCEPGAAQSVFYRRTVPKLLYARQPEDAAEKRKIRKLAASRHAPGD
jgi:hypothetical protein